MAGVSATIEAISPPLALPPPAWLAAQFAKMYSLVADAQSPVSWYQVITPGITGSTTPFTAPGVLGDVYTDDNGVQYKCVYDGTNGNAAIPVTNGVVTFEAVFTNSDATPHTIEQIVPANPVAGGNSLANNVRKWLGAVIPASSTLTTTWIEAYDASGPAAGVIAAVNYTFILDDNEVIVPTVPSNATNLVQTVPDWANFP